MGSGRKHDGYDDDIPDFRRGKTKHSDRPNRRRPEFDAPEQAFVPPATDSYAAPSRTFERSSSPVSSGPTTRVNATVEWFNPIKGFGFVKIEGQPDAFLAASALGTCGRDTVRPGAVLDCEIRVESRGPSVITIHSVDESNAHVAIVRTTTAQGPIPRPATAPRGRTVPKVEETTRAVVKFFNAAKGFGFVTTDSGVDVFVHVTAAEKSGIASIQEGDIYLVGIGQGEKGKVVLTLEPST